MAWIGLIVFLAMGFTSLQGMVLCFEPDGRVSLESAIGGLCSDSFEKEQQVQKASSPDKERLQAAHCQRCVDVPISFASSENEPQKLQISQYSVDMQMVTEAPAISVGYLATATQQQLPNPPPLRPALHRFLSTVVLLI
jgi:hypothetical protein